MGGTVRTSVFLLPPLPLDIGVPVVDRRGRTGVVIDKWYNKTDREAKVKVCHVRRYDSKVLATTYSTKEVRADISTDIGYVYVLREYFKMVNAKVKEQVKAYAWTWGGLQEQAIKWWAGATSPRDQRRLTKMLLKVTNTEEH
tara:strand:+ start:1570 stop:1995 length:426 start_codon:yes stop_codon:yes gene_type:complete